MKPWLQKKRTASNAYSISISREEFEYKMGIKLPKKNEQNFVWQGRKTSSTRDFRKE
jgi:hypothetical protein